VAGNRSAPARPATTTALTTLLPIIATAVVFATVIIVTTTYTVDLAADTSTLCVFRNATRKKHATKTTADSGIAKSDAVQLTPTGLAAATNAHYRAG